MKLKAKLPENRTYDQVLNHYIVEKAIADKLKKAGREDRKIIYATMYDELFEKVPDHPRLMQRDKDRTHGLSHEKTFRIIKKFIDRESVFLEFAPGDCQFSYYMCKRVKQVYAVDISKQAEDAKEVPPNFDLNIYNGYDLDMPDSIADILFSDHFIEHLHPEDVGHHLCLAIKLLKKNGKYIFRTPHAFFGPWDVSFFFSDKAEGFHLKEWTFTELDKVIKNAGYGKCVGYWRVVKDYIKIPIGYFKVTESIIGMVPHTLRKRVARYFIPRQIVIIAIK